MRKQQKFSASWHEVYPKGVGQLEATSVTTELANSYCSYAAAVNIGRAIPLVTDGLKPSQRRVLYAMHELNLRPDSPVKKVARIDGDVTGKLHPHGSGVGALIGMAQDHGSRYKYIDGQGNFGTTSDPAAAARYIEARVHANGQALLLTGLDEHTVQWKDNYDGSMQEPVSLPSRLPTLLLRDTAGIGVAAACSHVSYNLYEVAQLAAAAVQGKLTSQEAALKYVVAPDFAMGGLIEPSFGLTSAMITGQGSFHLLAKLHIDPDLRQIIATELPQDVSPERVLEQTRSAIADGKLEAKWLVDVRDESDRFGTRVVWEYTARAHPEALVLLLHRYTDCRVSVSVSAYAVKPDLSGLQLYGLSDVANEWAAYRRQCETSRQRHLLAAALSKLHLVQGQLIALFHIQTVAKALIEGTELVAIAELGLSAEQAAAIEAMPLRSLKAASRERLEAQERELQIQIDKSTELLGNAGAMTKYLLADIKSVARQLGDARRTQFYGSDYDNAISEAGSKYFAALNAAPKAPEHHGWLIDLRATDSYYRQPGERHKEHRTQDSAGAMIVAVGDNGQLWAMPPQAVPMGGKEVTSIRRLVADWTRQPLDPAVAIVWHGIVYASKAAETRIWLLGNRWDRDEAYCKLITLDGIDLVKRRPKWLGLVPVAGGAISDLGIATVVTAEYADGHQCAFDLRKLLTEPTEWHKRGSLMQRQRLAKLHMGNATGKARLSKSVRG